MSLNPQTLAPSGVTLFNGVSKPLSTYFASLALAQAAYPLANVQALAEELDGVCTQQAIQMVAGGIPVGTFGKGGEVKMPQGVGIINKTLLQQNLQDVTLKGQGQTTQLRWNGPTDQPVIRLRDANYCQCKRFIINSAVAIADGTAAIVLDRGVGGSVVPSRCRFNDVWIGIELGKSFWAGWSVNKYGPGGDANNELHKWNDCTVEWGATRKCGWHIYASQAHQLRMTDCDQNGGANIVWAQECVGFHWDGGSGGATTDCDFRMDSFFANPATVDGWNSESSKALAVIQGSFNGDAGGVTISNTRFNGTGTGAEANVITANCSGPVGLYNNQLFYNNACRPRILLNTLWGGPLLTAVGNRFRDNLGTDWSGSALRAYYGGLDRNLYWQQSAALWQPFSSEPLLPPTPILD